MDLARRKENDVEGLAPPLKCLIEIHSSLQNAEPAREGVNRYIQSAAVNDHFAVDLRRFLFAWDQGNDWRSVIASVRSPHRRALMDLLSLALAGQPILPHLEELKIELMSAVDLEIKEHMELLPIKMLLPLLLLQFPAFLLLLFGPLLTRLIEELNK